MKGSSINVGVVGLGYWGPNLARNFDSLPGCNLVWCCDQSEAQVERWRSHFPSARFTTEIGDLLDDSKLDAVVVATPVPSHAQFALEALEAGKHCFVEKPLAHTEVDAEAVVATAARSDGQLMVGHLLEYHPALIKLKEIVARGELGGIHYIYTNRVNLGKIRSDENALWSLGAHDLTMVLSLVDEEPVQVSARGRSFVRSGVEDVVFCDVGFPSGVVAHLHLSWLDPHKERRLVVVGSKKMATFDDMDLERKVTVFDKGFDPDASSYGEYLPRSGDIWSPQISNEEPLRIECRHFLECVQENREPISNGESGLRVVRVLELMQKSLEGQGETLMLQPVS